jgi:superfamily I DNA/RNA helicase/Zn-dependent peptidase ImmA (M78 family)
MDAFDSIRQVADRLHLTVLDKGANPTDPLAMATAAAHEIDLVLIWLAKGDPALKGARALYDHQTGTICCEEVADPTQGALVVAHEVGHAVIHAGTSACTTDDIDPSRSTESAPVGLQRVEDYGARERRELQADVFAREFLLPQASARRMHIEDGLGASAISKRMSLPLNLVRQQLLDALLLPQAPTSFVTKPIPAAPSPDPSQERAAAHRGSAFQLQAGPGTGKTRTLVKRVLALLAEGIDPASILILTFSNRAAGELSERIAIAAPEKAPRIWIGTFHAFGLDLVRRFHDRLNLTSNPSLFDRSDLIEVLEDILPTLPLVYYRNLWDPTMALRDVVVGISRAKDELVDPTGYRELAEQMKASATDEEEEKAAAKSLEVAAIYDVYEKMLRDKKAVDFGDLIMRPALLLESDEAARTAVQLRHRHILVDEYQDVNRASARLLKTVAGNGKQLWVVGDSRQSIYRFRGASSANMARFGDDYSGAAADQLGINYRSTAEVVATITACAPRMKASEGMLTLNLTADRGAGGSRPEVRRYETPDDELAGIAANIRELESNGVSLRDQAVLCRSNGRLNEVAAALEERGIPVLHLGSLFERDEVRNLLSLLSIVIDPYGDGLARVAAMPRYSATLQDVYVATKFLRASALPAPVGLASLATAPDLTPQGCAAMKLLAEDLAGIAVSSSAWEVLTIYILDKSDLGRQLAGGVEVSDRMRALAIWQLMNFIRDQSPVVGGLPIRRTLDRVRQLVLLSEERDLRQVPAAALDLNAVRLMTIHGSKGLEFDAVHIPGLTVGGIPLSYRGQRCPPPVGLIEASGASEDAKTTHAAEEECLFFVALSRARTHLRLSLFRKQENGNNRNPSSFLTWLTAGTFKEIASPATLPKTISTPILTQVAVVRSSLSPLTDARLVSYDKCPRRYFYTHILGLGGARKATAYTRTHDCIFRAIDWLAAARAEAAPNLIELEAAFEEIWVNHGPTEHGLAVEYRGLASKLLKTLIDAGNGRRFRNANALAIDLANGRVLVEPSEIAELPDGTILVRRVRTGQKRSDEYDRLEYTLYQLAGKAAFGEIARVEAVHLADGSIEKVGISDKKINTRRQNTEAMLTGISAGHFPLKPDSVTCPRCPHFFLCPSLPTGTLTLP